MIMTHAERFQSTASNPGMIIIHHIIAYEVILYFSLSPVRQFAPCITVNIFRNVMFCQWTVHSPE